MSSEASPAAEMIASSPSQLSAKDRHEELSALLEHNKLRFVHQTGVAIVLGFLMGLVIYFAFNDLYKRMVLLFRRSLTSTTL